MSSDAATQSSPERSSGSAHTPMLDKNRYVFWSKVLLTEVTLAFGSC